MRSRARRRTPRVALNEPLPLDPAEVRQLVFLGQGFGVGLAREAALKVREAAQAWSEAHPALEYRHGPICAAGPGTVVWSLGELPAGLRDEITASGSAVVEASGDPMAELVRVQRFAVALAQARGLDPDQPRNPTRSVVLEWRRVTASPRSRSAPANLKGAVVDRRRSR